MNIIDKAMERLAAPGELRKGSIGDTRGDGPVCIFGALMAAQGTDWFNDATHSPAGQALVKQLEVEKDWAHGHIGDVVMFNDSADTSMEDALLLMKKASARLDEQSDAWA